MKIYFLLHFLGDKNRQENLTSHGNLLHGVDELIRGSIIKTENYTILRLIILMLVYRKGNTFIKG